MGQPAAKAGDKVIAVDTHIVMAPSPNGPTPTPLPHPFAGAITGDVSNDVNIMGRPAATQGSTATNTPPHAPMSPGVSFQKPPSNQGTIQLGSTTVLINGKPAARNGDLVLTCNDPLDEPVGKVVAVGTVLIGG